VRVVPHPTQPDERAALERLGAQLLGPGFSAEQFL
jgi:hypothetical protein